MSQVRVNMTDVSTRPTPIDPGFYAAVVEKVEQQIGPKAPYLAWTFRVVQEGPFAGRKAFFNTTLAPQGLFNLKRTLMACGFPEDQLAGEVEFSTADLIGAECTLVIVEGVYQGETTGAVDRVLPAGAQEEVMQ